MCTTEERMERAAAAAARNQYGIKTHTIKIGDTRRRNKNTRSKRLWCFVSHRLWQHKIQRNNISTVKLLLFFFVSFVLLLKSHCIDFVCTSEKKIYTKEKNHSNRKAVEEHAKIACRFWYYKCMFGSYFRRSFLVFDLAFFFIFRFWDRFISRIFSVV